MENKGKTNLRQSFKGGAYYVCFKEFIRFLFNHILYRKVYYQNTENILPDGKPQVIVSDHQNCLIDAIAVMLSFKGKGRRPFFWARADIFAVNPLLEKYLRFLGLMPAFRMDHEGLDDVGKNTASFEESFHLLNHGQSVMLFPEAGHQDKRYLGHFTSGYTTMAFLAAEESNFQNEIFILPAANHYSDYFGIRREMIVRFGKPIALKDYYQKYQEKPRSTMRELNNRVREEISSMMLNITDLDNYTAIDFLRNNYGKTYAALLKKPYRKLPEKLDVEQKFVAALANLEEEKRTEVYSEAASIVLRLSQNKISFAGVHRKVSWGGWLMKMLGMLILLPLWVFSLWPNAIWYHVPRKLTCRVKDKMLSGSFLLGVNAVVGIPLLCLVSFVLIWCFLTVYMAIAYLLITPLLTLLCWNYTQWWKRLKEDLRLLKLHRKSKNAILHLLRKDCEKLEDKLWSLFRI